jgi:hypothetical protein
LRVLGYLSSNKSFLTRFQREGYEIHNWFGAILALLGITGLALPEFTTSPTKDVAKLGGFKRQSTQQSSHVVPQTLSGGGSSCSEFA